MHLNFLEKTTSLILQFSHYHYAPTKRSASISLNIAYITNLRVCRYRKRSHFHTNYMSRERECVSEWVCIWALSNITNSLCLLFSKDLILNFFVMIFLEHICLQNQFTIGATLARILKIYAISNVFFIKAEQ